MRITTVFDVSVPPDRVAAFLADPRRLIVANHEGPVVERSDGPLATGSWFVLGFDQLRARVEYIVFEPPLITAKVALSGRGSGGMTAVHDFRLSPTDGGGTRVETTVDGSGGRLTWEPLMRLGQALSWRRLRKHMERLA